MDASTDTGIGDFVVLEILDTDMDTSILIFFSF